VVVLIVGLILIWRHRRRYPRRTPDHLPQRGGRAEVAIQPVKEEVRG
jgi:hypothetical protein